MKQKSRGAGYPTASPNVIGEFDLPRAFSKRPRRRDRYAAGLLAALFSVLDLAAVFDPPELPPELPLAPPLPVALVPDEPLDADPVELALELAESDPVEESDFDSDLDSVLAAVPDFA